MVNVFLVHHIFLVAVAVVLTKHLTLEETVETAAEAEVEID
jgi:cell division protein FtsL|tara:strand:+ start:287 stop:409 length:123 start_codon:yes stop_codon:yes gene_type:complete